LVNVMAPPREVIPAELFTRFSAASPAVVVFVKVNPPPFNVIPDVLTNAWFSPASANVCPTPIVVAPLHPVVEVPFSVNVFATNPAAGPPESVKLPVPATAPVMVAPTVVVAFVMANVFSVIKFSAAPNVSVFAPKFNVYPVWLNCNPPTVRFTPVPNVTIPAVPPKTAVSLLALLQV
jgi:hypothetical protein